MGTTLHCILMQDRTDTGAGGSWCAIALLQIISIETHEIIDLDFFITGKSFSEALILTLTNPKYDKRLFIELRVQYMKIAS